MKFNITIDLEDTLSDMFCDESTDIEDALKGEIINSVVREVLPRMKENIDKKIGDRINEIIKNRVDSTVEATLNKAIDDGVISINGRGTTVKEHIQDLFTNHRGWNNPEDRIVKVSKEFASELKLQYNNVFAMKIVSNMKEQGLLKDDVALMLTEKK